MSIAPVVLFTYNRLNHVKRVIDALAQNKLSDQTDLFIYSDAPRNEKAKKGVEDTRRYLHTVDGFHSVTIIERSENYGLARNIIDGVTTICNKYGSVIVLEDDHVTSPFFLQYMNDGLERYADNPRVASIHGYVYPHKETLPDLFFIKGADCWSWATWKRAWDLFNPDGQSLLNELKKKKLLKEFDFDYTKGFVRMLKDQIAGKNQSWAIRWSATAFLNDMYTLYPNKSMTVMIGADGSGTHSGGGMGTHSYDVDLNNEPIDITKGPSDVTMTKEAYQMFKNFFMSLMPIRAKLFRLISILLNTNYNYTDFVSDVRKIIQKQK